MNNSLRLPVSPYGSRVLRLILQALLVNAVDLPYSIIPSAIANLCFAVLARFVPFLPFLPLLSLSPGVAAVAGVAVPDTPLEPSSKLPSPDMC